MKQRRLKKWVRQLLLFLGIAIATAIMIRLISSGNYEGIYEYGICVMWAIAIEMMIYVYD